MAERLGWKRASHGGVGRVERGERGTDPVTIERWLDACEHDVYLVSRRQPVEVTQAVALVGTLDDDARALLLRLARALPDLGPGDVERLGADVDYLERAAQRRRARVDVVP